MEMLIETNWMEAAVFAALRAEDPETRARGRKGLLRYIMLISDPRLGNIMVNTQGNWSRGRLATLQPAWVEHLREVLFGDKRPSPGTLGFPC